MKSAELARLAVLRCLITCRAAGRVQFDRANLDEIAEGLVYALMPLLLADEEFESHGARRAS